MLIEKVAKELVEVSSGLLGGRTVNIMDVNGTIVASTEKERVGSFHQGAKEAIETGRQVIIRKDQLGQYPGAREGYNMPLRVNGSVIGAVGIFGTQQELQYLAPLLELYAAKYYQLEAMTIPHLAEQGLRGRLLQNLLAPTDTALADAKALLESLRIHLELPLTVAIISPPARAILEQRQESLINWLLSRGVLRSNRDVWGIVEDRIVLLCSHGNPALDEAVRQLDGWDGVPYRVCLGEPCKTLWDVHSSYEQLVILDLTSSKPFNDILELDTRCHYILYHTAVTEAEFIDSFYQKLNAAFPSREQEVLMKTAQGYYDNDRSVSKAAAALFIHKNTLQYRVHRLLEALGLAGCTSFQQEYLVRLLLEHYKRKQGLRALQ